MELSLPDDATNIRKVRERIMLNLEDPSLSEGQTMQFRLVDGNGNPVVFPLQLISDTTFR